MSLTSICGQLPQMLEAVRDLVGAAMVVCCVEHQGEWHSVAAAEGVSQVKTKPRPTMSLPAQEGNQPQHRAGLWMSGITEHTHTLCCRGADEVLQDSSQV